MTYALIFLLGVAVGACGLVFAAWLSDTCRSEPAPGGETYGHPISPVAALKKGLPAAPPGFLWEITVELQASSGYRFMTLKLLDMATSGVVTEKSGNLDWYGRYRQSWVSYYSERPGWLTKGKAQEEIIHPMLDWAITEARKRAPGSGPDFHQVIS